ncbi:hypothetical protein VN0005_05280 [Helicobacter pylori]
MGDPLKSLKRVDSGHLVFNGGIRISQNVFKNSSYFKLKLRKYLVFNHNLDLDKKSM